MDPEKYQLNANITQFEQEIYSAIQDGYILDMTDIVNMTANQEIKKLGVEIMFDENICYDKIKKIKQYINKKYNFFADIDKYYTTKLKIVMVRYTI